MNCHVSVVALQWCHNNAAIGWLLLLYHRQGVLANSLHNTKAAVKAEDGTMVSVEGITRYEYVFCCI